LCSFAVKVAGFLLFFFFLSHFDFLFLIGSFCCSPFAGLAASFVDDDADNSAGDGVEVEVPLGAVAWIAVVSKRLVTVGSVD
jgi:hypothetical protein